MSYTCEYITPATTYEAAVELLQQILPLYATAWDNGEGKERNAPFNFNASGFINMWLAGGMILIVCYDKDNTPVGFLIAVVFTPMAYSKSCAQLEFICGLDKEVEKSLYTHFQTVCDYKDIQEIWTSSGLDYDPPLTWNKQGEYKVVRFTRK